ncbi:MAG: Antifreeze glycopeptide polyprotein precursor [Labilithrix sp.]|nr:Antifreeze glycopeptide polyprotein precursor [Labilithrix sp.]
MPPLLGHQSGARASSTLTGDLGSRPLAVLLAGACERKTSGTFTLRALGRSAAITLRGGQIAVVRLSEPVHFLGTVLFELGAIDQATHDASLRQLISRNEALHGALLVGEGVITQAQLDHALAEQTYRKIAHLFRLPDSTTWMFRDDVDELAGERDEGRPMVPTARAIWRALRDAAPSSHVKKTLAKIESGVRLRDLAALDALDLTPAERAMCERIAEKPASLTVVFATTAVSRPRTEMLLYMLALLRAVTRVDPAPVGPIELGPDGVRARAAAIVQEEPRTILGVREGATAEAARAAYFRLARLWHPERTTPELAEVRSEIEIVFAKLAEAHKVLGDVAQAEARASLPPGAGPGFVSVRPDGYLAPPSGAEGEHITLHDVDAALARGDLDAADTLAHSLSRTGSDGPTARAIIAWCTARAGNGPVEVLERGLVALDRLLLGDPECVRGLFYRAQLALRLGMQDVALRDLRKVVRLEPGHQDAVRDLRLHEIAGRPSLVPGSAMRASSAPSAPRVSSPPRLSVVKGGAGALNHK